MARILVIDDDPVIRELLIAILEDAGHEARGAGDGSAGIKLFDAWRPDVVMTDLLMPEVDGVGVIRHLSGHDPLAPVEGVESEAAVGTPARPRAPIIALSGGGRMLSAHTSLEVAKKLGACRVVEKPFSTTAILEAVNEALALDASS